MPLTGFVRSIFSRAIRLSQRGTGPGRGSGSVPARASRDWVTVVSDTSAILPEMYRELLAQHGIPAVVYGSALISGVLGGTTDSVQLLVPVDSVDMARRLLNAVEVDDVDGADRTAPER